MESTVSFLIEYGKIIHNTVPIIAVIFLTIHSYYYFHYLKEAKADLSISEFLKFYGKNATGITEEIEEQKKNFWKKQENESKNKKLAKLFFWLPIITTASLMLFIFSLDFFLEL